MNEDEEDYGELRGGGVETSEARAAKALLELAVAQDALAAREAELEVERQVTTKLLNGQRGLCPGTRRSRRRLASDVCFLGNCNLACSLVYRGRVALCAASDPPGPALAFLTALPFRPRPTRPRLPSWGPSRPSRPLWTPPTAPTAPRAFGSPPKRPRSARSSGRRGRRCCCRCRSLTHSYPGSEGPEGRERNNTCACALREGTAFIFRRVRRKKD